ncbi:hypothetical protein PENARI_c118G11162 [Penicillium arizonense]|uniref:BZIP domain-containing protein n=1 Tax=Penicillium arizonense TaxID=1835702 RepID=A0A1F5L0I0_PENAI|nr:hypothetical protein PENARI_c131G07764 [Penicillium arizonense]XP_022482195.1 hypothetical protein PENARI_c126G04972 [Penicillium arizonense]XP_022482201.1 hypothetical protein PENARI_c125G02371 [Penicillium arizonense]XP_022482226.1 hypothetical protein PENARI_c118G11162 [Penicillium arizonense]OGE46705.1 hypothetical protein PENARI_c131G07764 [Penicillium arizonense]OGE46727.1 hypothetical protein PENARI_c126G04972 [Penicillium arizonense]OGE46733.1 hypothetical protein PENARI_c125G02371
MATTGSSIGCGIRHYPDRSNGFLFHDPYAWSTLPVSYSVPPPSENQFTFHAPPPDPTFSDRALLSWDAATCTQPLSPSTLDASPDLGPNFSPEELAFITPSMLTPRDNLNVSDSSTVPPTPSPSASSSPSESSKDSSDRASRRRLNTLAARRYRQRRVDRTHELEAELDAIKQERDALKMRVSKLEGEANVLKYG